MNRMKEEWVRERKISSLISEKIEFWHGGKKFLLRFFERTFFSLSFLSVLSLFFFSWKLASFPSFREKETLLPQDICRLHYSFPSSTSSFLWRKNCDVSFLFDSSSIFFSFHLFLLFLLFVISFFDYWQMYDKNASRDMKCTRLLLSLSFTFLSLSLSLLLSLQHSLCWREKEKKDEPFLPSSSIIHCHNQPPFFLLFFLLSSSSFHLDSIWGSFLLYSLFFLLFLLKKEDGEKEEKREREEREMKFKCMYSCLEWSMEESDEDDVSKEGWRWEFCSTEKERKREKESERKKKRGRGREKGKKRKWEIICKWHTYLLGESTEQICF